jgi:hypothetical protein
MQRYVNGVLVDMTDQEIADLEAQRAAIAAAEAAYVPPRVTPYQARMALLQAGLLDAVEALMADPATERAARIAWEYATVIERRSPFITALAPGLGLTSEQIDNLFRAAAQIE